MFRAAALRRARPQARTAKAVSTPPPIGGWNARDSLAQMKPTDAIRLINWWPRTTDCVIRNGADDHLTGVVSPVLSLVQYNALNGTNKMFAVTASAVYDSTNAGAVGASVATVTDGFWNYVNAGDGSAFYLIMVNGVDKPKYYNGTTWIAVDGASSPALTGITTTLLANVNLFKNRLYFVEKNSLSFWYLAAGTIGGALTEYSLEALCRRGGYLMAMATWTIDGGSGQDDLAVFITSEGEAVIFQGTSPSSVATWALVGVYYLGRPIGRKCFEKFGGDVILLTEAGALPLSRALQSASIDRRIALTDKIESAFATAAKLYYTNTGWQPILYPAAQMLLINIPSASQTTSEQYAMNTITKAWTRFTGWNAMCFIVFNGLLYFGQTDGVALAWSGRDDFDANIVADAKTAFNYFGDEKTEKEMALWRPVLRVDGEVNFLVGLDVDYGDAGLLGNATYSVTDGAIWSGALDAFDYWDQGIWGTDLETRQEWQDVEVFMGRCYASKIQIATKQFQVEWVANDYVFNRGGIL